MSNEEVYKELESNFPRIAHYLEKLVVSGKDRSLIEKYVIVIFDETSTIFDMDEEYARLFKAVTSVFCMKAVDYLLEKKENRNE